eukprot:12901213-Heterocapsa_arctica.AAC.1
MLGIALDDDKGRFQVGVLVASPISGSPRGTDLSQKLRVYAIHSMRAVSGHSHRIDQAKLTAPLGVEFANDVSALTHKTQACRIPDIIRWGLRPGGLPPPSERHKKLSPQGDRMTINLCPFLPSDPRNIVVGRVGKTYDAVI